MLLKDVHPFIAEILDGTHDEILIQVESAVKHRRKMAATKSGIRPGVRVRLVDDPRNGKWSGREGIVVKVNPKSISIDLACESCGNAVPVGMDEPFGSRPECCNGFPEGLRVRDAAAVEVVPR